VRAGAFFPQAELQVPQKEMRQHRREHMMVPASVFAYFIVIHPEFRFAFFEALLNGLITNDKFCCTRWGTLHLSWWRRPRQLRR
jgi:anti-sigma factor RsiW